MKELSVKKRCYVDQLKDTGLVLHYCNLIGAQILVIKVLLISKSYFIFWGVEPDVWRTYV